MSTKTLTDAEGNRTTYDIETNKIVKIIDKHGFIYNSKGLRVGSIHGEKYIEGYYYD
jgi:hypothetical protein